MSWFKRPKWWIDIEENPYKATRSDYPFEKNYNWTLSHGDIVIAAGDADSIQEAYEFGRTAKELHIASAKRYKERQEI